MEWAALWDGTLPFPPCKCSGIKGKTNSWIAWLCALSYLWVFHFENSGKWDFWAWKARQILDKETWRERSHFRENKRKEKYKFGVGLTAASLENWHCAVLFPFSSPLSLFQKNRNLLGFFTPLDHKFQIILSSLRSRANGLSISEFVLRLWVEETATVVSMLFVSIFFRILYGNCIFFFLYLQSLSF